MCSATIRLWYFATFVVLVKFPILFIYLNMLLTISLTGKSKITLLSLKINLDLLKKIHFTLRIPPAGLVCFRFYTPKSYKHD